MRILLIHNNFSIHGGAEVFYHEVGRILESHGHEVAYYSIYEKDLTTEWKEYFPSCADYQSGSLLKRLGGFPGMVYSHEAKRNLVRLIADFRPDIAHAFATYIKLTPAVFDACRQADLPLVASFNDYKNICPNYKLYHHGRVCEECKGGRFYKAVINKCCHQSFTFSLASMIEAYAHRMMNIYRKNIHTFLFASEFMAKKTEAFWGEDSFTWRLLRNPFDSTQYEYCNESEAYLLFFGRLVDEKGVDTLIRAMAQVPDAQLKIVGDGPQEEELRTLCSDLDLKNIEFLGAKWGEELDAILRLTRFVVVPSLWYENLPYVINQSFAFGKAVIGSNRGGIPELVAHGERGLIYDALDVDALAESIGHLWSNPEKAKSMGKKAKEFSDREFNDRTFYRNLIDIYASVLGWAS